MPADPILAAIQTAVTRFRSNHAIVPRAMTKFTGAVTIEVIRSHLIAQDIPTSNRDVFISGIPIELDLLVAKHGTCPAYELNYPGQGVLAVLEIKYSGVYNQAVIPTLRSNFDLIVSRYPHIRCMYVTVMENQNFRHAATETTLNYPVFTLNWWSGTREQVEQTNDWISLVTLLQDLLEA